MISILINLIAVIWGLSVFGKKQKRYLSVVISYFLLTDWFGLLTLITGGVSLIKNIDFFILYMFLLFGLSVQKGDLSFKNDKYSRVLLWFALFHLGIFLMTVLLGFESFKFAVQDSRALFIYLIYFPLRRMDNDDIIKAFKSIFVIEIFIGINYLLQFVGIFILKSYDTIRLEGGMVRYTNVAPWFLFFLIYLIVVNFYIKYKYILILYLGAMLILPMSRMRIILFCLIVFSHFIFVERDYKKILKISAAALLISIILSPYLFARVNGDNDNVSMIQDIEYSLDLSNKGFNQFNSQESGTLGFRIAMLLERINFMYDNPKYALFGVGFRHEYSPNCYRNFNFYIGTYNESLRNSQGEIHSVDINWVRILMEMGIFGVLMYLGLMYTVLKTLYRCRSNILCYSAFLYVSLFVIGSFTESVWTENYLFILFVSIIMVYCLNLKNNGKSKLSK